MEKHSIVIAQVGSGRYHKTTYMKVDADSKGKMKENGVWEKETKERGIDSNYTFEAVIQQALRKGELEDPHLILVGTASSAFGLLYNAFSPEYKGKLDSSLIVENENHGYNLPGIDDQETQEIRKSYESDLSEKMRLHFSKDGREQQFTVTTAIIKIGAYDEELQENFNILQSAVDSILEPVKDGSEWDIYFDISNGFRSFPIYIYTLINYLSRIGRNVVSFHMFYGMYDAKGEYNGVAPLVDLQVIDDLMLLINAVNEFRNCGSVVQIYNILMTHPEWNICIGKNDNETLSYAFELFDYGTNANNLAAIEQGIKLIIGMKGKLNTNKVRLNEAERLLLKDISDDFAERFDTGDKHYPYTWLMIHLACWYHEQRREGNAAIAVQESIITYLMERFPQKVSKYLSKKGKADFKEPNDLLNPKNLFNHDYRDPIKGMLSNLESREPFEKFYENYDYIRENIRNVMAHISYIKKDGEEGFDSKEYRDTIKWMVDYMLIESIQAEKAFTEKKDESYGNAMINILLEKENRDCLVNMLNNTHIAIEDDDSFSKGLENFRKQLRKMDECRNFNEFYGKIDELPLVFKVMDDWILDKKKNNNEELKVKRGDYKNYYSPKNGKSGFERLCNVAKDKWKSVIDLLEKAQG